MDHAVKAAARQVAYAKIPPDGEANGHNRLAMAQKAVASVPGRGSDQEDDQ